MFYDRLIRNINFEVDLKRLFVNLSDHWKMQGPLPTLSFAIFPFPSTTCKSLILRSSAPRPSSPDRKDKGKSTYKDFLGESEAGFILFGWQKIWRNLVADSLVYMTNVGGWLGSWASRNFVN